MHLLTRRRSHSGAISTASVILINSSFLLIASKAPRTVGIHLFINKCSGLVACLADVRQGFARPRRRRRTLCSARPTDSEKKLTDTPSLRAEIRPARLPSSLSIRPASLTVSDSSSLMVILAIKWVPPTFPPTKTSALDGRSWTLVEQNTAGAQVKTSLEKSRVKFWKLSRSMKKEMGC